MTETPPAKMRTALSVSGWTLVAVAWIAGLVLATFLPLHWKIRLGTTGSLHLWFHLAVFWAAGFLAYRSAKSPRGRFLYFSVLVSISLLQESVEASAGGNRIEWWDVAADFAGLLLALWPTLLRLRVPGSLHSRVNRFAGGMRQAEMIRRFTQLWLALLILGSLQPARPRPVVSMHLGIHLLAFGGAAFLLLLVSTSLISEIRAVAGMCLLGLTLELMQHFIYGNVMEWWDVKNDAIAVVTAFVLYRLVWGVSRGLRRQTV